MTPDQVVSFWEQAGPGRWFYKDAAFDGALKIRFGKAAVKFFSLQTDKISLLCQK